MPGVWTKDDEKEYPKLMGKLAIIFNRSLGVELLNLYRDELDDLDGDQVVSGLKKCVRECRFWPTIAEVRERSGAGNVQEMQRRIETREQRRIATEQRKIK